MPMYEYVCEQCNKHYDITMKFSEHEILKDKLSCKECGTKLIQCVSSPNFHLKGEGWFPKKADEYDPAWHGIDKGSFNKNLDLEKKIEDQANNMAAKDKY